MHALGFFHEQQRPDRDMYVNVDETKISRVCSNAFELIPMYWNKRKSDSKYRTEVANGKNRSAVTTRSINF